MIDYLSQFLYPKWTDTSNNLFEVHQMENKLRRQRRQAKLEEKLKEPKINWRKEGF